MAKEHLTADEIEEWLVKEVRPEITRLADEPEEGPECSDHENHAYLQWFANYVVRVPDEQVQYPANELFSDGASDGGIDIFKSTEDEDESAFDVYQISRPALTRLYKGKQSERAQKLSSDLRSFRKAWLGKQKKLNRIAKTAFARMHAAVDAVERMPESERPVTITIHPVTLNRVQDSDLQEFDEAKKQIESWSTNNVRWIVRDPIGCNEIYALYRTKVREQVRPEDLTVSFEGDLASGRKGKGPYLCFVRAVQLIEKYDKHGIALLDANLRGALKSSDVNARMKHELATLKGHANFKEKNNGVVLGCRTAAPNKKRKTIKLTQPQVLNGGQTISSLHSVWTDLLNAGESRTEDEQARLDSMRESLLIACKIVENPHEDRINEIAVASNTQNALSPRTMKSSQPLCRRLRESFVDLASAWYLETKDGEWSGVSQVSTYLKHRAAGKNKAAFTGGKGNMKYRFLNNQDVGIAQMAFLGFFEMAKAKPIFDDDEFLFVFGYRPRDEGWASIEGGPLKWNSDEYDDAFERGRPSASQLFLAYLFYKFWRTHTLTEARQFEVAAEAEMEKDPEFAKYMRGDKLSDEGKAAIRGSSESIYWPEQVAKSVYMGLVYQSMRVLFRRYGPLSEATCANILQIPQFQEILAGKKISDIDDFRTRKLVDGPLFVIARMLHKACELLWQKNESKIRNMGSRHRELQTSLWVKKLSEEVDTVFDRIGDPAWRIPMMDPEITVAQDVGLTLLLPEAKAA